MHTRVHVCTYACTPRVWWQSDEKVSLAPFSRLCLDIPSGMRQKEGVIPYPQYRSTCPIAPLRMWELAQCGRYALGPEQNF